MDDIYLVDNWTKQHTYNIEQWVDPEDQWVSDPLEEVHDYLYVRDMAAVSYRDTGINTICGNSTTVYLGTLEGGIKRLAKSDAVLDELHPTVLDDVISTYLVYPNILDFNIRYLHCNEDYMGVITPKGMSTVKLTDYKSVVNVEYPTNYQAYKCFITSGGYLYFTMSGTSDWRISKIKNPRQFNYTTSLDIITGSGILNNGIKLTDLYITERTAKDHIDDTVFCATTSGIYVIDLSTDEYYVFAPNNDYNFTSVWADPSANLNQNKVYVSSAKCLYVIDMERRSVYSKWKSNIKGVDGNVLFYGYWDGVRTVVVPITDDIVDINKI